jgi:hypothetical protein
LHHEEVDVDPSLGKSSNIFELFTGKDEDAVDQRDEYHAAEPLTFNVYAHVST